MKKGWILIYQISSICFSVGSVLKDISFVPNVAFFSNFVVSNFPETDFSAFR